MYRHVIWDWNGTLLDDAWLSLEIINQLLTRRGLSVITAEQYGQVFGFPLAEYCRQLGFDFARESFEAINCEFMELYEQRRLECRLRAGARQVLAAIRRRGLEQSLLSAYQQDTLEELVEHFALKEFFSAIVGVDNPYGDGKVALGKRRMAELGLPGCQVLLVGDTLHDLEVAQAMGIDCVLVPSGHQHRQRLESGGARVVDKLEEVLKLL